MNYSISSDKFSHPLLKPILKELTEFFEAYGIKFFLIGATARDIIMEMHNESSGRLTYDLDIAITINDWKQFGLIEQKITDLENFSKDPDQKQRFYYRHKFQLDIVPFGGISKNGHKIFWPPEEGFAMSVLGFSDVESATLTIDIDKEIEIKMASLAGIFLLKIVAWKDRNYKTNKDADDMAFILSNYLEIYRDRSLEFYEEIYTDDHTVLKGGAILLGKDINTMLCSNEEVRQSLKAILFNEIAKKEESKLMNQIMETHKLLHYDEVFKSMENIVKQLA